MSNDIFSPFLLVPNLDFLYVLDEFDKGFSSLDNFASQQLNIINLLKKDTAKITSNEYDVNLKRWSLIFTYGEKERQLIHYGINFNRRWPDEIDDLNYTMSMGTTFEPRKEEILKKMLMYRTTSIFTHYSLWRFHEHYDQKILLSNGKEIAAKTIQNKMDIQHLQDSVRIEKHDLFL